MDGFSSYFKRIKRKGFPKASKAMFKCFKRRRFNVLKLSKDRFFNGFERVLSMVSKGRFWPFGLDERKEFTCF